MAGKSTETKLKVTCTCGASLMAPKKAVGKKVRCPRCSKILTVPDPGSTVDRMLYALADEEYNRPAAEDQPKGIEPVVTEKGTKLCPQCQQEMPKDAVFCVRCGFHLERGSITGMSQDAQGGFFQQLLTSVRKGLTPRRGRK